MIDEPLLMQFQNGPLNCDTVAQAEFIRLQEKHGLQVAIETGTCLGYTTAFLASFYPLVKTAEFNIAYLKIANLNRLHKCTNIHTHWGDSAQLMRYMLKGCNDSTFIFLDAHWGAHCPLKEELARIADSGIKPVIAIHDFQVPDHPELGFDSIDGQPFNFDWLKDSFDAIYGKDKYIHYYNSEALGAQRGIIYLEPSESERKI